MIDHRRREARGGGRVVRFRLIVRAVEQPDDEAPDHLAPVAMPGVLEARRVDAEAGQRGEVMLEERPFPLAPAGVVERGGGEIRPRQRTPRPSPPPGEETPGS